MSLDAELVVIGGGMAGAAAAVEAARAGVHCVLVSTGTGATELSSALFGPDVASASSGAEPLGAREDLSETSWSEALALLERLTPELGYQSAAPGTQWILASSSGALRQVQLAPAWNQAGELTRWQGSRVGVAHLTGLRDHDGRGASLLLRQSCAGLTDVQGMVPITVTLRFLRRARDQHLDDTAVARLLDDPLAQDALAQAIRTALQASSEIDFLLLPPVIGLEQTTSALFRLQALAGLPMAEMSHSGGGVPGLRLARALRQGLSQQGVEQLGGRVRRLHVQQGSHIGLDCDPVGASAPLRVRARHVILATGHLPSGGIRLDPRLRESLADLPLWADGALVSGQAASQLVRPERRAPHPLMRAGVRVDARQRVLAADGRPLHPRLLAAGSLVVDGGLGHMGRALLSGMRAARTITQPAAVSTEAPARR